MSTNSAERFAPWWEITSWQDIWKNPKPKPKKTPSGFSESDKGLLPALICKVGQGPASCPFVQGCLFINFSTMRRLVPNLYYLHHGDSPGSHQANVGKMLWISTKPSAFCHGNPRQCQNELRVTGPAPADSVMASDDDSSIRNRKLRGKVSYSSKPSALPLEMHGWCIPSILRVEKSHFSCLHPVLGCSESREDMGVKSPSNTRTHKHVLGGIYLHI